MAQRYMPKGKHFMVLVWGESGVGKTTVIEETPAMLKSLWKKAFDEECDFGLRHANLTSTEAPDFVGMPTIQNGKWVDVPKWAFEPNSRGIFFADETDRPFNPQTANAFNKFAVDRQGDNTLPEGYLCVGACNGASDINTQVMSQHTRGRAIHLYASLNVAGVPDEYDAYAEKAGIHEAIRAWRRMNPMTTKDEYKEMSLLQPRTMDQFANAVLKLVDEYDVFEDVLIPLLAGAVGKAAAAGLIACRKLKGLPTLGEVVKSPSTVILPDPNAVDVLHTFAMGLAKQVGFTDDCKVAERVVEYLVRFPKEVARAAIEYIIIDCPNVVNSDIYQKWQNRLN